MALLLFSMGLKAQTETQKNGFAINQNLHDFNISLLDKKVASFDSSLSQSIRVSYWRYLTRSFSFNTGISNGFLFYQYENGRLMDKSYFIGVDAGLQYNIGNGTFIPATARVKPFVSYGNSLNYINKLKSFDESPWGFSNQYGLGVQIKLANRTSLRLESAIDQELGKSFDTHMQHRLGFIQTIGKRKEEEKPEEKDSIPDYDEDGIADADDKCPTIPGLASSNGCPEDYVSAEDEQKFMDSLSNTINNILAEMNELKDSLKYMKENPVVIVRYEDKQNPDAGGDSGDKGDGPIVKTDPQQGDNQGGNKGGKQGNEGSYDPDNNGGGDKVYADAGRTDDDHPGIIIYDPKKIVGANQGGSKSGSSNKNQNKSDQSDPGIVIVKPGKDNGGSKNRNNGAGPVKKWESNPEDYSYPPLYKEKSYASKYPQNSDSKIEEGYYVIAISTVNLRFAQRTAEVLRKTYPIVEVLQNEQGFYRVGIYATRTRSEANKILQYSHEHGLPYAWISKQSLVFN